jgi:hypothetical protein
MCTQRRRGIHSGSLLDGDESRIKPSNLTASGRLHRCVHRGPPPPDSVASLAGGDRSPNERAGLGSLGHSLNQRRHRIGLQTGLRPKRRSPDRPPHSNSRPSQGGGLLIAPGGGSPPGDSPGCAGLPGVGRVQRLPLQCVLADAIEAEVPVTGDQRRDGRPCSAAPAVAMLGSRTMTTPVEARTHTYLRCAHRGRGPCGNGRASRGQPRAGGLLVGG